MIEKFVVWLKNEGKSENTIKVYLNALQKLNSWYEETEGNSFEPSAVTTLHIHEFHNYMDKNEGLEPSTINKVLASLKTYFKYCLEAKLIIYNPMLKVKMKRAMTQYAAPKWLSKQERSKFFHAIEQVKNEKQKAKDMAMCRLMCSAGLRVQEVSDLNILDICLESKKEDVTVRGGKGNKYRIVPLNSDVTEALIEYLKYRDNYNSRDPLFINGKNNRAAVRSIHRMVVKYAKKAGVDDVSPHTLRHTFCKNLIDQGVGLERVAYLAGHESLETTRRYTQPSSQDLRKAVQTIAEKR